ncbi:endochitinase [Xylariaceae sp. AK1471]|nr:endochitinase [Xylariaceae sp. AK1471]KAI3326648.1 endochitinase [Xylariaceae sp. AK1471]
MIPFRNHAPLLLLASLAATSPTPEITNRAVNFKNAVYFTNWGIYARNYQPAQLPASQLDQVLYSFANFRSDGTVYTSDSYADLEKHYNGDSWNDIGINAYGCVKQLYGLKQANRQLKVLLSIGGWTYSPGFAAMAASDAVRTTFAKTAVELIKDWVFDGIDIDWEWPASETEANDMVSLLTAIRKELDSYSTTYASGYHFLLSVCLPAGPANYKLLKLSAMNSAGVDQFNMLAYDYAGSWDTTTGHQANLYPDPADPLDTPFSTDAAIEAYIAAGVPANKIILGLPLYGRAFENTAGLGQAYSGVGSGSWDNGIWDYKVLPRSGTEIYDATAGASYSYDNATGELISYDNVASVQKKVTYLQSKGLGGTMFWEASGDRADSGSLIAAAYNAQGGSGLLNKTHNLLSYPNSKYDNIKKNLTA